MANAYDVYSRLHNTDQTGSTSAQTLALAANGALAIDWSLGNTCVVSLAANATSVTMANPVAGQFYTLVMVQDATGSRTWASAPANVKWLNTTYLGAVAGVLPALTTTASKRDTFVLFYDGTNYVQVTQILNS